ncbi:MAG TPA: hypothetical protein VJP79_05720 [Nitrososphaera sp.]|nr:hypothetical protein [Nitrososphaera sp.]
MQQPSIEIILNRIREVIRDLEGRDISAKVTFDDEAKVIKVYGEGSDYVKRAISGLADVQELAYTTAEHHPYWAMLYHASEISKTVLEKWDTKLSADQISEMTWRCDEIKMALERVP